MTLAQICICCYCQRIKLFFHLFMLLAPCGIISFPIIARCQVNALMIIVKWHNAKVGCSWNTALRKQTKNQLVEPKQWQQMSIFHYCQWNTLKSSINPRSLAIRLYWSFVLYCKRTGSLVATFPRRISSYATTGLEYT